MKAGTALLAVLCLLGGGAFAQPSATRVTLSGLAAAYDRCSAKAVTNVDFSACGAARLKDGDILLNTVWKRVYGATAGQSKRALLAEQRLWIAYKDKSCAWWLTDHGREGQIIHYPLCRAAVVEDRIGLLADMETGQ